MEVYVISPVSNLEFMEKGDRIFALAHLWIKFPHYREFIKKKKDEGWYITLDNSAAERSLVTEDILIDICKELMPDEVIAPDVLFNKKETCSNAVDFHLRLEEEGLLGKIKIFFCPQGNNREEWLEAYNFALEADWIDVIGFSKIAVPRAWLGSIKDDQYIMEARHNCYNYLKAKDMLKKPIHCLGQGDPKEFEYYDHPMMRSTDSVYPVWAAMNDHNFMEDEFERIPTPHNLLETAEVAPSSWKLVNENIDFIKECAGSEIF